MEKDIKKLLHQLYFGRINKNDFFEKVSKEQAIEFILSAFESRQLDKHIDLNPSSFIQNNINSAFK